SFVLYKCPHGMIGASSPIFIAGEHVANVFSGQVFIYEPDETIENAFREQAEKFGFDETEYMKAFQEVPVFAEEKFRHALPFLSKMAKMIADTGFMRLSELESEKALQNSEKELRSLFRAAPIGIGLVCDRVFTQVNDRMCEMTGYSKKELIGQSARMLYSTDEEYDYVGEEKYKQILSNGTGSVETKWEKKDRKIIDIVLSSTPIDLNDLSKGVTFTALDITSSKKKASELLESEEKYRSIMDSMVDATYICSSNYRIEYMNPAMILRTGYDATGEICYKVIHGRNK
ncbi:MAG: PAS domain S-box protein, partial [Bacteroidetes bacterium]|nr:PAS domain S-box protein [Bacteroidota bacterium]